MIKICYVVTIPLTIRSFFIPQLKYLAKNNFSVTVVCNDDGMIVKELGEDIHFHECKIPRGISLKDSLNAIAELTDFFKKEEFDLIQYSTPNAAFCSAIASKRAGCKIRNYHLMGYRFLGSKGIGKIVLKTIERITCSLSTSIECVSKSNLDLGVAEKLFKKNKAVVIWNGSTGGVDLNRFDCHKRDHWRLEQRKAYGYSDSDFVFGFVGRVTRDKGINELLAAYFMLKSDAKLIIVGHNENDGTINNSLWEKATGSPSVNILDSCKEIEKIYSLIDILVLPSYREGFGNVIIEGGAMGVPSIVTSIPGPIDAAKKNVTALFCKPHSVNDLYETMKTALTLDCKKIGNNAATFVINSFDNNILCEKILERKQYLLSTNQHQSFDKSNEEK